jgi:hypothetical protein
VQAEACALLCPILDPAERQDTVKESKATRQLAYFNSVEIMQDITANHLVFTQYKPGRILVIRGARDTDAESDVAEPDWLPNHTSHVEPDGTHKMCTDLPQSSFTALSAFVESTRGDRGTAAPAD